MISMFVTGLITLSCQLQSDVVLTYSDNEWTASFTCNSTAQVITTDFLIYDTMTESIDISSIDGILFADGFES